MQLRPAILAASSSSALRSTDATNPSRYSTRFKSSMRRFAASARADPPRQPQIVDRSDVSIRRMTFQ
jgi:hypothetical protein